MVLEKTALPTLQGGSAAPRGDAKRREPALEDPADKGTLADDVLGTFEGAFPQQILSKSSANPQQTLRFFRSRPLHSDAQRIMVISTTLEENFHAS